VGVIPFKILGEMSTVGSTSHHGIRGIEHCLGHLMKYHGLQSVRNSYETHKIMLSRAEMGGTCEICFFQYQNPTFLLGWEGKTGVFKGYCGDTGPNIY